MFTENELLTRARMLFPEAKTDIDALNDYAQHTFNSLKKYYGKPKLKAVWDNAKTKYDSISALRKKLLTEDINESEVKNEKEESTQRIN